MADAFGGRVWGDGGVGPAADLEEVGGMGLSCGAALRAEARRPPARWPGRSLLCLRLC